MLVRIFVEVVEKLWGGEIPKKIQDVLWTFCFVSVPGSLRYLGYFGRCGFLTETGFLFAKIGSNIRIGF